MSKVNILSHSAFWIINKAVLKEIGVDATLLLSDFITKQEYFTDRNMLNKEGFFFNDKEDIERDTTLTSYRQTQAVSKLSELKLIELKKIGIPHRFYYKVDFNRVNEFVSNLHI